MYKTHFNKHIARLAFAMLIGATALTSCDDYLDVRPKGEKLEDDQFKTSEGIEATIYGVYGSMQSTSLYGKDLYWGLTDIMSQDLNQNKELEGSVALSKYQYTTDNNLRSRLSNVWTAAYQTIGYANNVLKNLDKKSKNDFPLLDLYKGEMLAVRAYLHFDLLRLFCSTDPTKKGIPYTTTYEAKINDFKKVGEVYDLIIKDLQDAEQLLTEEKEAIVYPHNNEQYFKFQNYRETHCNYYAVLGILAKVYWMKGDMDNAAKYAQMVIDSNKFPLAEPTEVQDLFAGNCLIRKPCGDFTLQATFRPVRTTCISTSRISRTTHIPTLPALPIQCLTTRCTRRMLTPRCKTIAFSGLTRATKPSTFTR